MDKIPQYLTDYKETKKSNGFIGGNGELGNYKVSVNERGIFLYGSLSKFWFENNFYSLSKTDTYQAIENLSDSLSLPIINANIHRIDIAQNMLMDYPINSYIQYMGIHRYMRDKIPTSNGLYFRNKQRQIYFYDKIKESKRKRVAIPDEFKDKNVLRYELRFMKNLKRNLNYSPVEVTELWKPEFVNYMENEWKKAYNEIQKNKQMKIDLSKVKSQDDYFSQALAFAFQIMGGETVAYQHVNMLREANRFKHPKYYSRMRRKIKRVCEKAPKDLENDLIHELDEKINQTKFQN